MREVSAGVQRKYSEERLKVQSFLGGCLRDSMSQLVGSPTAADVLLVPAGPAPLPFPAHLPILRRRAPGFFDANIAPKLPAAAKGALPKVPLDIEEETLRFFLSSIYTAEEVAASPELALALARESERRSPSPTPPPPPPPAEEAPPAAPADAVKAMEQSGSDQSGLEVPIQRPKNLATETAPTPIPESLNSSTTTATNTAAEGPLQTSFQELHSQLSQSELELDVSCEGRRESGGPLMTSFRQIALESPLLETRDFVPPPVLAEALGQSPDSFGAGTPLSNRRMSSSLVSDSHSFHQPRLQGFSSESNLYTTPGYSNTSELDFTPGSDRFIYANLPLHTRASQSNSVFGSPTKEGKIFPLFIQFDNEKPVVRPNGLMNSSMEESGEFSTSGNGTLSRVRRRLSAASLRSLDSADLCVLSPGERAAFPPTDGEPCSKLGADLLALFLDQRDTDVEVRTDGGPIGAHRCVLSATCPAFSNLLSSDNGPDLDMTRFSHPMMHFLLSFLYGGVTTLPEGVSVWEIVQLANELELPNLIKVAELHISAKFCHFFHKPCGGCVTGVLEILGKLEEVGMNDMLDKCLNWQGRHFARVWKTRAFAALKDPLQGSCFNAVLDSMSPSRVVEIILGCERLQATLPRNSTKTASFESVASMVSSLLDTAVEFISNNFDKVIVTETFLNQGRGLGLNVSLLEDVLPGVIHSLSPDTGCRVLVRLYELLVFLSARVDEERRHPERLEAEWSERFFALARRLYELADTHLIHSAAAVVRCESWRYLTAPMQQRIRDTGLFIEIEQPRAPPPRLSSLSRTYKRSLSSGAPSGGGFRRDRSSSSKRRSWAPRLAEEPGTREASLDESSLEPRIPEEVDVKSPEDVSSATSLSRDESSQQQSLSETSPKPKEYRKPMQSSSGKLPVAKIAKPREEGVNEMHRSHEMINIAAEQVSSEEAGDEDVEMAEDPSRTRPASPAPPVATSSPKKTAPFISPPTLTSAPPAAKRVARRLTQELTSPSLPSADLPESMETSPPPPTQTPAQVPISTPVQKVEKVEQEEKVPPVTTGTKASPPPNAVPKAAVKTAATAPPRTTAAKTAGVARKAVTPGVTTASTPVRKEAKKPTPSIPAAKPPSKDGRPPASAAAKPKAATGIPVSPKTTRKTSRPTAVKTTTNSAPPAAKTNAAKTAAFKAAVAKKPA